MRILLRTGAYRGAAVSLALIACAGRGGVTPAGAPSPLADPGATVTAITPEDLRRRLFIIAHDSMMGRETGSEGNFKTAAYVAAEFQRLGLEPAGENGTYFQTVPFWRAAPDPASRLSVGGVSLQFGRDFVPANWLAPPRTLDNVRVIFGGHATDMQTQITPEQAAGKVVVLDVPVREAAGRVALDPPHFSGAALVVGVQLDEVAPEVLARVRDGRPAADTTRIPSRVPVIWVNHRAAELLLGANPSTLAIGTEGKATVSGFVDVARKPIAFAARNVVAILRGSDPVLRNQYVALTAHNDHVGFDHAPVDHDSIRAVLRVIRPMGADSRPREPTPAEWTRINRIIDSLRKVNRPRLDSIRNGADDDGSGTVSILEIAEAMARSGVRPRRSILFVNHTAEEVGLIGSRWYASHSTVPIDSIVGEIDQDMVGRGLPDDFPIDGTGAGSPTYLEVIGAKRISREFGDSLEAANARQPVPFVFDYRYDAPGHPLNYYCRADHYSYARYGIPAVAFSRGEHLDYHQVTDEPQYISYPDLARVSKMVYDGAMAIANMSHAPRREVPKPANPNAQCRQ
jgi:hypothetical protein